MLISLYQFSWNRDWLMPSPQRQSIIWWTMGRSGSSQWVLTLSWLMFVLRIIPAVFCWNLTHLQVFLRQIFISVNLLIFSLFEVTWLLWLLQGNDTIAHLMGLLHFFPQLHHWLVVWKILISREKERVKEWERAWEYGHLVDEWMHSKCDEKSRKI